MLHVYHEANACADVLAKRLKIGGCSWCIMKYGLHIQITKCFTYILYNKSVCSFILFYFFGGKREVLFKGN